MKDTLNFIKVKGARENNLKNIDITIPKNKLIVFTGVSGSGKSSLAFNTIYEEGRRRYVDSLSSYARQFLGNSKKPLVESIEGLIPAIAIEQKTTHNNPRSTVATITEIYDYLRLLYARVGVPYCPKHKEKISLQNTNDVLKTIFTWDMNQKLVISSPLVQNEKGAFKDLFEKLKREGFIRVLVDDETYLLEETIKLDSKKKHNIDLIVDRLVLKTENKQRIIEAVEIAFEHSKGLVKIQTDEGDKLFSKYFACSKCSFSMPIVEPRLFSFNSPSGMCNECKGLGVKLKADPKKIILDDSKTIANGGIIFFKNTVDTDNMDWQVFKVLLDHYEIDVNKPLKNMTKEEMNIILYGTDEIIEYELVSKNGNKYSKQETIEGIATKIERRHLYSSSEMVRSWFRKTFMSDIKCHACNGKRLNKYALAVKFQNYDISQITKLSIDELLEVFYHLELEKEKEQISGLIINEIVNRLTFLQDVGLGYLTLDRKAETLSGGESQRIRLATQIGSNLTGVLYVLDEPSIGLHQSDNKKLIKTLKHMVELGNTLIVVEHDEETIKAADYIVDIGPLAGEDGGNVVTHGTIEEIEKCKDSLTGDFLSNRKQILLPIKRRGGNGKVIEIKKASENNLQNIDVKIPLGKLVAVTGVSGSGKSTLVNEILAKGIQQKLTNPFVVPGKHRTIKGIENINKLVTISQSPIGRTPRSNPATYTGVFDDIRDLFSQASLSRARGYLKGRFSFNVNGGRCDKCKGDGVRKIAMHFLPDVYIKCDLCEGKRYNHETLEVKYKGKTIADILDMSVSKAIDFFQNKEKIVSKLKTLEDVGLGYISLGQSATTLSGGEAQRVKLATFLIKKPTGKTLYILDEPTTGLHQADILKLMSVLNRIVDGGDSVLVIEHNLDVIKSADYIIDLGPGGGKNGGTIIAKGTIQNVAETEGSYTGKYLKKIIQNNKKLKDK